MLKYKGENYFNYIARGDVFLIRRFLMEMRGVRLHGVTAARRWWCRNSRQERQADQWTHADLKYSEERRQQTLKWGRRPIDEEHRRLRVRPRSLLRGVSGAKKQARGHFPAASHRSRRPLICPIFIWSVWDFFRDPANGGKLHRSDARRAPSSCVSSLRWPVGA